MSDIPIYLVLTSVLATLGFGLAVVLILTVLHRHRSPTSTFAWLLAIILLPYIGIPLYLLFGGRKLARIARVKSIPADTKRLESLNPAFDDLLLPSGVNGAFPTTSCDSLTLITDNIEALREVETLIKGAQHSIEICTYILGADATGMAILQALTDSARAGVTVRLLVDSYGSMSLPAKLIAPLKEAGGQVEFFIPILKVPFQRRMNLRNHRKTLIVDDRVAMIGGMNLSKDYMGVDKDAEYWVDICATLRGAGVHHIKSVFNADWDFALGNANEGYIDAGESSNPDTNIRIQFVASGPDVEGDPIHDSILIALFGARKRVWIVSPYILPGESLLKALTITAQRGIDVRLITPENSNHPLADFAREGYLTEMERAGARIFFYQNAMLHGKAMIVDDDLAFVGSANLDMRSMFFNFEIAGAIWSETFNGELSNWIEGLMELSHEGVREKNRLEQVWYGIGRLVAPIL